MSEKYTKLAEKIVYSSMWEEDGDTCKVWVTLLALRDHVTGEVDKNITGIARLAKLPVEKVEGAMAKFRAPDLRSTSLEHEGRRIEEVEGGGWKVLNHEKYMEYGWSEDKKRYERERKARWREEREEKGVPCGTKEAKNAGDAVVVLEYLKEMTGRKFRGVASDMAVISARLSEEGVDVEGIKLMIERQCKRWKGTEQEEYLRPATLFGKSKFDGYYAARELGLAPGDVAKAGAKAVYRPESNERVENIKAPILNFSLPGKVNPYEPKQPGQAEQRNHE